VEHIRKKKKYFSACLLLLSHFGLLKKSEDALCFFWGCAAGRCFGR